LTPEVAGAGDVGFGREGCKAEYEGVVLGCRGVLKLEDDPENAALNELEGMGRAFSLPLPMLAEVELAVRDEL
jgi:hypothetical protein